MEPQVSSSGSEPQTNSDLAKTITATHVARTEEQLKRFKKQHRWDPFLDPDKLDSIDAAAQSQDAEKEAQLDKTLIQEDSPYPEVRASVRCD